MLAVLNDFIFELSTAPYQAWDQKSKERWGSKKRFQRLPAYQHLGPDDETLTLPGVLAPELTGGEATLDKLRTMMRAGVAYPLVTGTGNYQGQWIITEIAEKRSEFIDNGKPRKIEFTISLKKYSQ